MPNDCPAGTYIRAMNPGQPRKVLFMSFSFLALIFFLCPASAWAGMTINAPGASAQITSRTPFSATATSSGLPITAMYVYLDYQNPPLQTYNGNGTSTLNVNDTYSIANGSHTLIANAWDTNGTLYQSTVSFTVSSTGIVLNAPGESAQSTSPVPFSATITSNGSAVTSVLVYLDWNSNQISSFNGNGTSSLTVNATYAIANGSHTLIVNSWDNAGQLYQAAVDFKVSPNGVVISVPSENAQVTSPVAFSATATSNGPAISAMQTYLDFNSTAIGNYNGNGTATLSVQDNYSISSSPPKHTIIANAWDTTGQLYQAAVDFTVGSSSGGSIPPSNATLIDNVDDDTWTWCSASSGPCISGNGGGNEQITNNVANPSLDGGSTQFYTTGSAWADVLNYVEFTPNDSATHFVLDYSFQVDNLSPVQALEFDFIQGTSSRKFNFSSQCDRSNPNNPVWDTWDEPSNSWSPTSISCANVLNTNNWHHVRLYGEMVNPQGPGDCSSGGSQTHYIWIEVDGQQTNLDVYHCAPSSNWHSLIVQVQQDLNANPGNGFNEYVDKLKLYVW